MKNRFAQLGLLACCAGLVFACGQSAPPVDDDEPDDVQPSVDDTPMDDDGGSPVQLMDDDGGSPVQLSDYFPLKDGATYQYAHSSGWIETVVVEKTEYEGEQAFTFSDSGDPSGERSESVMLAVGTRVYRVAKRVFGSDGVELPRVEYNPGFIRADNAWANESIGTELELDYVRTEFELDGTETASDRQHLYTVESVDETTKTAAGTFQNCLRIRRKRTWMTDIPDSEAQEKIFWFAPGIGKVREETPTSGNSELLIDYDLP